MTRQAQEEVFLDLPVSACLCGYASVYRVYLGICLCAWVWGLYGIQAHQLEDERAAGTNRQGEERGEGREEGEISSSSPPPPSYQILRDELERLKEAMREAEKAHKEIEAQYRHRQQQSQQKIEDLKVRAPHSKHKLYHHHHHHYPAPIHN